MAIMVAKEEGTPSAVYPFGENWQEEETVLSRGGDRKDSTAKREDFGSGGDIRSAAEAGAGEAGCGAGEALAGTWSAAK